MNKRGQSESGGTIVQLLLILAVAAIVLFAVWYVYDKFISTGEVVPEQIQTNIVACKTLADNIDTLNYAFCNQIRELGKNEYGNCLHPQIKNELGLATQPQCNNPLTSKPFENEKLMAGYLCGQLLKEGKVNEKTRVNSVVCSTLSCRDINGKADAVLTTEECTKENKSPYEKYFSDYSETSKYCCL